MDKILRETTNLPPPPPTSIQSCGVDCFLQVARTVAQHCMEAVGEGKLNFPFFNLANRQKGCFGQSVSTNFVANFTITVVHSGLLSKVSR